MHEEDILNYSPTVVFLRIGYTELLTKHKCARLVTIFIFFLFPSFVILFLSLINQ